MGEPTRPVPFGRLVAAEMRATWWARFGPLWLLLGLGLEVAAWLIPPWDLSTMAVSTPLDLGFLLAAACWVPTWLGSDLLSTRFAANPHPHREWPPREFLARAAGRLLPFLVFEIAWLTTLGARSAFGPYPSPLEVPQFAAWLGAWVLALLTAGAFYTAGAAWVSSMTRRPRRSIIAPLVGLLWPVGLIWLLALPQEPSALFQQLVSSPLDLQMIPGYHLGLVSAIRLDQLLISLGYNIPYQPAGWSVMHYVWLASACFTAGAIVPIIAVWWIVRKRFRR